MTEVWVDTDFGFDDLWALLLLRAHDVDVAGVSLVAGNAPLDQVVQNALGTRLAYGLAPPLYRGADRPLHRDPETAQKILGPTGIRSRGRTLPTSQEVVPDNAVSALAAWLGQGAQPTVLALGPLTNIAHLIATAPEAAARITRLVWMGGGDGQGNHTPHAEFNAFADPEAAALVAQTGLPLDIVDLTFCRQVTFGPHDLPLADPLTSDLLGGYLDIALERGRPGMAIYDPLAELAVLAPERFGFQPSCLTVDTAPGPRYGQTTFTPDPTSTTRLAKTPAPDLATACLTVLSKEALAPWLTET